jgi:hypothetical protein
MGIKVFNQRILFLTTAKSVNFLIAKVALNDQEHFWNRALQSCNMAELVGKGLPPVH